MLTVALASSNTRPSARGSWFSNWTFWISKSDGSFNDVPSVGEVNSAAAVAKMDKPETSAARSGCQRVVPETRTRMGTLPYRRLAAGTHCGLWAGLRVGNQR